jgi:hypothetical protein
MNIKIVVFWNVKHTALQNTGNLLPKHALSNWQKTAVIMENLVINSTIGTPEERPCIKKLVTYSL